MWPALTFIYATVCDSLIYSFVMRWVKKRGFFRSWMWTKMDFACRLSSCLLKELANICHVLYAAAALLLVSIKYSWVCWKFIGQYVIYIEYRLHRTGWVDARKKKRRETKNTVCVASGTQSLRFIPTLRRQYFMHHFLGYLHWFIFKTQISLCNMQCIRLPLSRLVLLLSFLPSIAVCSFSTERETRYF